MEAGTRPRARPRARGRSPICCRWRPRSTATGAAAAQGAATSGTTSPIARSARSSREIALGLIDLGIEKGDRVRILANTRPEWTYADFAITSAGGVVVPIYPTNSPEECEWVIGNSEAVAVVCEDAAQVAKIVAGPRPACRTCATSSSSTRGRRGADAIALDELRERGRGRDAAELEARTRVGQARRPVHLHLHLGHDRPAEGLRAHAPQLPLRSSTCASERGLLAGEDDLVYLFLPLAHAFALLIQLRRFDAGATIAYCGGDTKQIVPELIEVKPDLLPVGAAHLREDLHARLRQRRPREDRARPSEVGVPGPRPRSPPASRSRPELQARLRRRPTSSCSRTSAPLFGGSLRQAVTGAAPIAKEILEFFYACGVPVLEGYGMTETATAATYSTLEDHKFGTVGRAAARRRGQDRRRRRDPHQGREHLPRLLQERRRLVRRDRRRLAAHRRPRLDRRGRLPLDHRPQEGHHHHRGRQEPHAGEPRERPQAVALGLAGGHARRPAAVPGDADHARRGGDRPVGRSEQGSPTRTRRAGERARRCASSSRPSSTRPTRSTPRSSRSRSSRSSTTTSRRRPAS